jgi:hypothetical protein
MKSRPVKTSTTTPRPPTPAASSFGVYAACAAAAIVIFLWAYGPVMHAPFVFDDTTQAFAQTNGDDTFSHWKVPKTQPAGWKSNANTRGHAGSYGMREYPHGRP